VQAIFDPYFDNRALSFLLDILSFGATVSGTLRLLACKKQAQRAIPRLTKLFVADWFKERGVVAGEVRLMPDGEHRRFILLGGGQSLLLGMSLNSINNNEAIPLEPDVAAHTIDFPVRYHVMCALPGYRRPYPSWPGARPQQQLNPRLERPRR
jgi:hypothetical protein